MNFTLQLHGERLQYVVPPGLYELMSDIGREVLRDQPTALYQFISEYLDTLVKVRAHSRVAGVVLGDIIDDNRERIAFVRSLGVLWDEANASAVKIQRAYRRHHAKRMLKEAVAAKVEEETRRKKGSAGVTPSYIDFIDHLSQGKAYKAASKIKATFKAYKAKEALLKLNKGSGHTIDDISPKPGAPGPSKRDSGLLVYDQSTTETERSSWSKVGREMGVPSGGRSSSRLVYQGTSVSTSTFVPSQMMPMPSYYDRRRKVPMISKTGEIMDEERSIVTLFSTDTMDTSQKGTISLEMPPFAVQYEAKEIFEVIDKAKPSKSKSSIHTLAGVTSKDSRGSKKTPPSKEPSIQLSAARSKVASKSSKISAIGSKKTHHSSKSRVVFALPKEDLPKT